jgi:hypothetical protein
MIVPSDQNHLQKHARKQTGEAKNAD